MGLLDNKSPKSMSIEDCVKEDRISSELWAWSEGIEKWGKRVFIVILIVGLISAIVEGWLGASVTANTSVTAKMHGTTLNDVFGSVGAFLGAFFLQAIQYGFYALIEYFVYHLSSILVGALAGIYDNTRKTSLLTEYKIRKEESSSASVPNTNPEKQ